MKQLEFKKELNLDKPEDVDWLLEWAKQAWQRIQELEAELINNRSIIKAYNNSHEEENKD